ncbi:hypothetical protein C0995_007579 [Termitomyces sp. Mi166|nr:hypothetical protein C0995_007579 [Termitomyces sp. Mi166\
MSASYGQERPGTPNPTLYTAPSIAATNDKGIDVHRYTSNLLGKAGGMHYNWYALASSSPINKPPVILAPMGDTKDMHPADLDIYIHFIPTNQRLLRSCRQVWLRKQLQWMEVSDLASKAGHLRVTFPHEKASKVTRGLTIKHSNQTPYWSKANVSQVEQ